MDAKEFEEEFQRLTDYLDQSKTEAIKGKRESDRNVIKANTDYSSAINQLDANWGNVPTGQYDRDVHMKQRQKLLERREEVEHNAIRDSFSQLKDEAIDNFFSGEENRKEEAQKRLGTSPQYQWLRNSEQDKDKTNTGDLEYTSKKESLEKAEPNKQPDISARFDDVAEKDYQETHNKFNRSAKTNEPEQMKGYPDTSPFEGRKTKGDIDLTKEYNAGEEFPGFNDYSPGESNVEPTMNRPDIDIGDRD